MRNVLLYLLQEIQACEYYSSLNIRAYSAFMSTEDLEAFVVDRHAKLSGPEHGRILKIAQSFRDRGLAHAG